MEKTLYTLKLKKILRGYKAKLEKNLNVVIKPEKGFLTIEGEDGYNEYIARNVLESINLGFKVEHSLQLLKEDYMFEQINIKDHVRSSRVSTVKGRVIGKAGKAKKVLEDLTGCYIVIHDNVIGIIGETENVGLAVRAIIALIRGSPHTSIYALLERSQRNLKEAKIEQEDFKKELEEKEELKREMSDEEE